MRSLLLKPPFQVTATHGTSTTWWSYEQKLAKYPAISAIAFAAASASEFDGCDPLPPRWFELS